MSEATEEKSIELKDISQLGRIEKTQEVFNGLTVTLQSLSASHQHKALAALPPESLDTLARFTALQIETLIYATIEINGKKYNDNNRSELRSLYSEMQNKILQEIYGLYTEIAKEQNEVITSLKKT